MPWQMDLEFNPEVYPNFAMAMVIATSLVVTIVIAKNWWAAFLPILAKQLHMDPAIMASPAHYSQL